MCIAAADRWLKDIIHVKGWTADDHLFASLVSSRWRTFSPSLSLSLSFVCVCARVCLFNKLHTREIFYDSRPACPMSWLLSMTSPHTRYARFRRAEFSPREKIPFVSIFAHFYAWFWINSDVISGEFVSDVTLGWKEKAGFLHKNFKLLFDKFSTDL